MKIAIKTVTAVATVTGMVAGAVAFVAYEVLRELDDRGYIR